IATGCSKKETLSAPASPESPLKHEHHPPHGGTPVVLGDEVYHIELVLDASSGKLSAYIVDGEMENFIRSSAPSFEVTASVAGQNRTLNFIPVSNSATGEKIGDTSQFETEADWLKSVKEFDGVLKKINVRGTVFSDVAFNFPKGNDKDDEPPAAAAGKK
ncbi:MAG TPA: hypothetical protein VKC60_09695, partial [Opitutaceae bacterium]|nr:hypothetical protein [Opitutaceae bacterium]